MGTAKSELAKAQASKREATVAAANLSSKISRAQQKQAALEKQEKRAKEAMGDAQNRQENTDKKVARDQEKVSKDEKQLSKDQKNQIKDEAKSAKKGRDEQQKKDDQRAEKTNRK